MSFPHEIDVIRAAALLQQGALVLDVREPAELAVCQLAGCLHVPMQEIPARLAELPPDAPVLVLCHHGGRSARVTMFLRANGIAQAVNVAGGIDAWALQIDPSLRRY
ncbi:MAG: rhodanese-like domain-containing protein [Candidatus Didemnitutus sp.]|nr:rhodanese-like domain-containing protein [Candidatus Didemnitutus sp.]